jgi:hypothetical protein
MRADRVEKKGRIGYRVRFGLDKHFIHLGWRHVVKRRVSLQALHTSLLQFPSKRVRSLQTDGRADRHPSLLEFEIIG